MPPRRRRRLAVVHHLDPLQGLAARLDAVNSVEGLRWLWADVEGAGFDANREVLLADRCVSDVYRRLLGAPRA